MKKFWCVHHIINECEFIVPCSSEEVAKKLARDYKSRGGKVFIVFERKDV